MIYENVKFGKECREKMIEGVNLIADAIKTTYGPDGQNVMCKSFGGVKVTKDGATVATWVNDPNPFIQMGVDVIKEISKKTADEVGDASSTAAILSQAIVNTFKDTNNATGLSRVLKKECEDVIAYLNKYKKEITSEEDLEKVATIAANNDPQIGQLVAGAFAKVGKDGVVKYEESDNVKDSLEFSEGFEIESGFHSAQFINNTKGECVLKNVLVYISDTKIKENSEIIKLADQAYKEGSSLLLIAPDFESELLMFLLKNLRDANSGLDKLPSCMVPAPYFGDMRSSLLQDMRLILGDTMRCSKVVITRDKTTFTGYKSSPLIDNRIKEVREIVKEKNTSELEYAIHQKRLANLTSGMATIKVGGYSQVEMKERFDRVEDAVRATRCALEGGVLPGGGIALLRAAIKFKDYYISKILSVPAAILTNKDKTVIDKQFWYGKNIKTNKYGNMYNLGVVEPFQVVKTSLENAVSVAATILTTNCSILNG